jgi:hypothetical protein
MFKRFALHFVLIFLFAFAQIGAATHAISHIEDFSKHSQDDKKPHSEQCAQCLSAAQIGSGVQTQPFIFHLAAAEFNTTAFNQLSYSSLTYTAYAARGPPQFL